MKRDLVSTEQLRDCGQNVGRGHERYVSCNMNSRTFLVQLVQQEIWLLGLSSEKLGLMQ
jgi:hypothetical protein